MPYRDLDLRSCANDDDDDDDDDDTDPRTPREDELAAARAVPLGCALGCGLWLLVGLSLYWLFH